VIRVDSLSKDLGEFFLKDVSLQIEKGEYFMVLGPTGAGKTILLETIAGIYTPNQGSIILNGVDITALPPRQRNIGMVYQDYMLFPHLNVEENIQFGLRTRKVSRAKARRQVAELTEFLRIDHLRHRYPGTLSGGEQQRVAIARALIVEPEVLLLDEPLSALDAETKSKLREELQNLHSSTDITILHVSHSFEEAFLLGNQMAIMNSGKVIQTGEPVEVFSRPNCDFVARFLGIGNLFRGMSSIKDGLAMVEIEGQKILSIAAKEGQVHASVRPEHILVSRKPLDSSAQNCLKGHVRKIMDGGAVVRITVDTGLSMVAALTRCSFDDMKLRQGSTVYLTFKAADVHLF